MRFNVGKFNVPTGEVSELLGRCDAISEAQCLNYALYLIDAQSNAYGNTICENAIGHKYATLPSINAISETSCKNYRLLTADALPSDAISGMTVQTASVYGISAIAFPSLVLEPGDKLIIDTNKMTVTLNGENVIHTMNNDGEFFALMQGYDIVTYSDSSNERSVNIKVEWKDRWL